MLRLILTACASILVAGSLAAQERRPSHCIAIADAAPGLEYLHFASWTEPAPDYTVRIHYVDHSMFLLQTPGGLSVATDYSGFMGPADYVPEVVTMNHAHSSHWTASPDPRIPHVLRGWPEDGNPLGADHYLDLGEMLIRNVPTNIRSPYGGGVEAAGNSIFVFEVEGLCIGHLGHLHHEPSDEQYAALGRLDVVMAPVDGGMTLNLPDMISTLKRLKSSIVIPMHWFGLSSLERFLTGMSDDFLIERVGGPELEVSLRSLPQSPTIMVLEPAFLRLPSD